MDANVVKKWSSSNEIISTVQTALRLLLVAVFLGSLLMWIMAPTNTYKQSWLPSILAKLNSTYFEPKQGCSICIILFSFVAFVFTLYIMLFSQIIYLYPSCVTGARLLIYTLPILFVAAMGCFYLHMGKILKNDKMARYFIAFYVQFIDQIIKFTIF